MDSGGQSQEEEVANECHQRAQQALLQGNYGRAFAHYLLLVRMSPTMRSEVKDSMTLALREWADQLEVAGRGHDVLACYQQACDVFPDCETMLSNMGAHLFRLGYIDEAACCFRRALRINPEFLGARENLDNVCGHLVERWHFRMLNDIARNSKFRDAIHAAVENGHQRILDIGTGTGLLSLFAVEAGASEIYGCEMSKTMYDVACDVLRGNQAAERVTLIHKKSTDLKIPEDLPEKVNLIVTETFDAGLLGERILSTLSHAWKELLQPNEEKNNKKGRNKTSKPKSCVIPASAVVHIAAIECEYIRKNNRLLYPGLRHVDLSEVNIVCRTGQTNGCHSEEEPSEWEPYTTEKLSEVPGGYKLLSEVTEALQLDFNNPRMIETYLQGAAHDLTLPVTRQGRLDAIALWFDLELYDKVTISTSPETESCWEQAIYPCLPSHLRGGVIRDSLLVKPGESLQVACVCSNNALSIQCTELRPVLHSTSSTTALNTSLLCQYDSQTRNPAHLHIPTNTAATSDSDPLKDSTSNIRSPHNYDLTICKPEINSTYLYQQAHESSPPQMLPPYVGQPHASLSQPHASLSQSHASLSQPHASLSQPHASLSQPHASLSQPHASLSQPHASLSQPHASLTQPSLMSTQTVWQQAGPWFHDPVWPQIHPAWPQQDPRLWPQPPLYQPNPYQPPQPQQKPPLTPSQYQCQQQQQQQNHKQSNHTRQLPNLHTNVAPRSEPPPPPLPPPPPPSQLNESHSAAVLPPPADSSILFSNIQSMPTYTTSYPRNPHEPTHPNPREVLPSPSVEYTNFLRQQLRDAVHAAEMDATYRSFVIRSQTAPDVRNASTSQSIPTTPGTSASNSKDTTPSTVWSNWTWGQPISRSVDSLVTAAKQGYLNNAAKETFLLDRYELSRLNDIDSNTAFCAALEKVKRNQFQSKGFTMLDLTRGFSTLPLQSLKIGVTEVGIMETGSQTETELLCCLAPTNGLSPSAVRFLCGSVEDAEPEWDVVLTELIDHCGALTQQVLEQIALARVTCLSPGGVVVPWAATVYGMVVDSQSLLNDSAVISDEHTLDLQVAQYMNDFQMTTHVDISLSTLVYKKLSQPFELFKFNFNDKTASKVPEFLNQSAQLKVNAIDSGQVTAVVYWFELFLTPEVKLSTLDTKLRWKQAAVMQKARPDVAVGRSMTIKAACKNSCIDIKVLLN